MGTRTILCTDDKDMAVTVPVLFGEFGGIQVIRRRDLHNRQEKTFQSEHFVLGSSLLRESDWQLCRTVINGGFQSVYLMLKDYPSADAQKRAETIGIKDILLAPMAKICEMAHDENDLFSVLRVRTGDSDENNELIHFGKGVYFNPKGFWVGSEKEKRQLSNREGELLQLFLQNEGIVLKKQEIVREIWGEGPIDMSTLRKLVKRLREKLGPAQELIVGRKQGGYYYEGDK
ncbi:MAG TPA: helix-turn-helix domain-containing protein [Bacillales bacterium]|nr:helix-turn-helix domain-containing protein [Bacillales bacterium]